MERKTLLIFNSVAVATTMLASAARADDSGRTSGTTTSPSVTTSPTTGANPSIAPSVGSPTTSPSTSSAGTSGYGVTSQGAQGVTSQGAVSSPSSTMGGTMGDVDEPVGTTRVTSSDAAILGSPSTPEPRDSVTVYRKTRPNPAMLATGSVLLAGTYVPTAIVAAESDRQADKNLYIPIVGPWLNLADRQCSGCDNETRNVALVVGSGVLQGLGAGFILASFLVPQKVEAATIQAGNVKMNVLPTQMGRGGAGVGAVGTF